MQCGEGGLLAINNPEFVRRAEILWEKGTNRAEFFRGEVNKYGWVDTGSSFLPAEYVCAFLWAQIEQIDEIQQARKSHWQRYYDALSDVKEIQLPQLPDYATNNGHAFFLITRSLDERTALIAWLKEHGIQSVFHYVPLHSSPAGRKFGRFSGEDVYTTKESGRLLRLPIYYNLDMEEVKKIVDAVETFPEF